MDGRTSLYSTIDQLVIKSQSTNQTIEVIKDYNRFMSSYLGTTNDLNDGLSFNNNANLQVLNSEAIKDGVVDNAFSLDSKAMSFALALPCGLLNGSPPIPLARQWGVGGLIIEIHLAPDNNVLFDKTGTGTNIANAFYQFQNVSLCCEVQSPSSEALMSLQKSSGGETFEYNSISSYYTTFNSTNAIINFSLGLSRVLSVFCNFVTSTHLNNRSFNGMTTYYPMRGDNQVAKILQVVFIELTALTPSNSYNKFIDGGANVGVGVAFDTISSQGVDFRTTNFGLNMDTELFDDNPQSVYMFVKSKNTLVFNSNGIQIIN